MTLILVRHAMPLLDRDIPPAAWPLSEDGRTAARALPLPVPAYLIASNEPKAYQTLEEATGRPVAHDPRFAEIHRVGEPWDGNYLELRRAYVSGTPHPGWEPHGHAIARFDAALSDAYRAAGNHPVVVGTHGMVMTLWLTARAGLTNPAAFWSSLPFPHAHEVPTHPQ